MPTYEYRCRNCGHEFEAVQSFTDDPLTECPRCEGPVRKRFGAVGISFKGSGFYKTDSRAASAGNGDRRESTGTGAGSGDGGGSSDTGSGSAEATSTTGASSAS